MTPTSLYVHSPRLRRRFAAAAAAALLTLTLLAASAASARAQSDVATTPAPPAAVPAGAAALVLHPGDAVKLTVWKAPEFDGEFAVLPNGTLAHPYLRDLVVAGMSLSEVQAALERRVRTENAYAQVVVQPLLRVVVGGEVRTPNLYRNPAGTSVAEAIILAGGTTEWANPRRLTLVRDGRSSILDLTAPTGPATRIVVESGDQLLVARRGATFRESVLPYVTVLGSAASIALLFIRSRR